MDVKHLIEGIQAWLDPLDSLPVECDGMTRVITALLTSNGIEHKVMGGHLTDVSSLRDKEAGLGPLKAYVHWWVELPSGHMIDYRARMWMGDSAQHGVFIKDPTHFDYLNQEQGYLGAYPIQILSFMVERDLTRHPKFEISDAELKVLNTRARASRAAECSFDR
jgi:hypothetical protein